MKKYHKNKSKEDIRKFEMSLCFEYWKLFRNINEANIKIKNKNTYMKIKKKKTKKCHHEV